MEQELISIIVPIYNAENYLRDCIESLINQTYNFIEILLIDNGSIDRSLDVCLEFQEKDSRIRVLQEGIRQHGSARNKGLSEMRGSYYAFVDADDFVSKNYIAYMYDGAKQFDADLVQCGVTYMYECRDEKRYSDHSVQIVKDKNSLPGSVWGKLYKSDVHGSARFTNLLHGEDCLYVSEVLKSSKTAVLTAYCLYGYRSYHSGLTRLTPDKIFFDQLDTYIADKNSADFCYLTEKCVQVISLRREERLYHKELQILKDKIHVATEVSIYPNEELMQKLERITEASHVSIPEYIFLRLKHCYTYTCARHRIRINYHCKLD